MVKIYDSPAPGRLSIKTKYTLLEHKKGISLFGSTAPHRKNTSNPSSHGTSRLSACGEGKYGKNAADRKKGFIHQALCSYKLRFDFPTDAEILSYLKGKGIFGGQNMVCRGILDRCKFQSRCSEMISIPRL